MKDAIRHNKALPLTHDAIETLQHAVGAVPDGVWGPETTRKLRDWQMWQAENPERLPRSCHGFVETDGRFGPYTQYALGVVHPEALEQQGDDKHPRPDWMETVYALAEEQDLLLGIDTYAGNDEPDWCQLVSLDVRVACVKVGQATRSQLASAAPKLMRARGAGMLIHGYFWFEDEKDPEAQGAFLSELMKNAPAFDIPAALDFEKDYMPKNSPEELRAKGNRALCAMSDPAILYSGQHFLQSNLDLDREHPGQLDNLHRWVAKYPVQIKKGSPALLWDYRPDDPWACWQVTSSGCHPSITEKGLLERTDFNVWRREALAALVRLQRGDRR